MNIQKLKTDIEKGKIAPVYFFYGDEKYLIDEATRFVIENSVSPEVRDFNLDIFYGNEVDISRVIDIAKSFPMMAERRTIAVKEAQKISAKDLGNLADYAHAPVKSTCLVIAASTGQIRGKAFSALKKDAVSIAFKKLYDNQVPAWIKEYVSDNNYSISDAAARKLHAHTGNSILKLVNELEKVFLNLGERKDITESDIQMVVGFNRNYTIFNLYDAVGERNINESLTIINHLIEHGEIPTTIIIRLTGYFSILLKILFLQRSGQNDADIAKLTGVHPYFVRNYKRQASNYTLSKIEKVFAYLLEADRNLKSSYQKSDLIMDLLIYRIISQQSGMGETHDIR